MRRLALGALGLALLAALMLAGCGTASEEKAASPAPTEQARSCVTCHSSEEMLKQTASAVEEVKSEATSGEG